MVRRWILPIALLSIPSCLAAQAKTVTIGGTVREAGSDRPIGNATVEVGGMGQSITSNDGRFRFQHVSTGRLTFSISALGYARQTFTVQVRSDTTLLIDLKILPVVVDSISVQGNLVAVRGRLVEAHTGFLVTDGEIDTDAHAGVRVNAAGNFRLDRLIPGRTIRLNVRSFGYDPVEVELTPERDTAVLVQLEPDSLALRLIAEQIRRLDERIAATGYKRLTIDRKFIQSAVAATAMQLVVSRLHGDMNPIRCVIIDDEYRRDGMLALRSLPADLVYRAEILERGTMVRIYTTRYIENMLAGKVSLTPVVLPEGAVRSVCS